MLKRCNVCGKWFAPKREKIYLVKNYNRGGLLTDAIDCPRCGCQKLLAVRITRVVERDNENECED